ncbi:MAG: DUF89 family protein, partial [Bacteroidales bacterium]|nr:DUF89 family protein [Bacteroidales bacterium]
RAFEKLLEKETISAQIKNSFVLDMINLYRNHHEKLSTPEFARELHTILKGYTNNHDPYKPKNKKSNILALEMASEMQEIINKSSDPFTTALRLAIAGNIIDFAANQNFDLKETINRSLTSHFAIDHSEKLRSAVKSAESVLYLGDNAGEIVFDKLFIKTMNHRNMTFAVRGMPVINDATLEDADLVGMSELAKIISNGYDAPSTLIEKSSEEFRNYFNKADLIIAKGQGNLEGLLSLEDNRIFFLLMVKCEVMAEFLQVEKGSFVVFNSSGFGGTNQSGNNSLKNIAEIVTCEFASGNLHLTDGKFELGLLKYGDGN